MFSERLTRHITYKERYPEDAAEVHREKGEVLLLILVLVINLLENNIMMLLKKTIYQSLLFTFSIQTLVFFQMQLIIHFLDRMPTVLKAGLDAILQKQISKIHCDRQKLSSIGNATIRNARYHKIRIEIYLQSLLFHLYPRQQTHQ